jgi:hypothetical protein
VLLSLDGNGDYNNPTLEYECLAVGRVYPVLEMLYSKKTKSPLPSTPCVVLLNYFLI